MNIFRVLVSKNYFNFVLVQWRMTLHTAGELDAAKMASQSRLVFCVHLKVFCMTGRQRHVLVRG